MAVRLWSDAGVAVAPVSRVTATWRSSDGWASGSLHRDHSLLIRAFEPARAKIGQLTPATRLGPDEIVTPLGAGPVFRQDLERLREGFS